ncbi:MAG TPA: hypothetical protein VLS89_16790, partial [Candidatus Nanopelagicales bacterium]|nr:hypothetical protein [Candidatus Nanopelagicales bacterium]
MASLKKEKRSELVRQLRFDSGQAEGTSNRIGLDFYPIPEHARALEPEVVLIVGDRGAGKTKLKEAATIPSLREAIVRRTPRLRVATGATEWRTGHPLHAAGPDAHGWQEVATTHRHERTSLQDLWFAYLVRVLRDQL